MCALSVQHRFTDEVHFLKDNGMKVQQENVLPFTAGRAGSAKDNGSPIYGFPFLLHLFHQSLYLLTLDVFWLFHKKKNCGQMVGLPVTFYLV